VFFGCPHRPVFLSLQKSVIRLTLGVQNQVRGAVSTMIQKVIRSIMRINEEFLDTNITLQARLCNIASRSNTVNALTPFPSQICCFDLPYELIKETSVDHSLLMYSDSSAKDDKDKYETLVNEATTGRFWSGKIPQPHPVSSDVSQHNLGRSNIIRDIVLSLAPPVVVPLLDENPWFSHDPYTLWPGILQTDQYKHWKKGTGTSILHVHGKSDMKTRSRKIWEHIIKDTPEPDRYLTKDVVLFTFTRYDARYSSLDALLCTMLCYYVSQQREQNGASIFHKLLEHRAWTTSDLLILTRAFAHTSVRFIIACLDECDEARYDLVDMLAKLEELSEMNFSFIITTTTGSDERLHEALARWPTLALEDEPPSPKEASNDGADADTQSPSQLIMYLTHLLYMKPAASRCKSEIDEVLENYSSDYRFGPIIVDLLRRMAQNSTEDEIRKTVSAIANGTPETILDCFVASFGSREARARSIVTWVTFAFEPLTIFEMAFAVNLSEGFEGQDLQDMVGCSPDYHNYSHDMGFDSIREDITDFGLAFTFRQFGITFNHPEHIKRRETIAADEAEQTHGNIAMLCLRYLSSPIVLAQMRDLCDRLTSLNETPRSRPRHNLISYAVVYWTKHYELAGSSRPLAEAAAFFGNREAVRTWSMVRYTLSNYITRLHRSYMSTLPLAAMTGLDDLMATQIQNELLSPNFTIDMSLALVEAARNGNASTVKLIADTSKPSKSALADALMAAAAVGDADTLDFLIGLAQGLEDINWPPNLFPRVAWLGLVDTARLLLASGCKVSSIDGPWYRSAIHTAALKNEAMVEFLLDEAGCDPNGKTRDGMTPLRLAVKLGAIPTIKKLLEAGADVAAEDNRRLRPLNIATKEGRPLVVRMLLDAGADVNYGPPAPGKPFVMDTGMRPLHTAAANGYNNCLRELINNGADVNLKVNDTTPLWQAADTVNFEGCRILLENGADPKDSPKKEDNVLMSILDETKDTAEIIQLARLLIEKGAPLDQAPDGDTWRSNVLSRAAGTGKKELVEFFLDLKLDPDLGAGVTTVALYVAAFEGYEDIVKLLLERGAKINLEGEDGWTAIHAGYDKPRVVKLLLEHGADINAVCSAGTVAFLAAKHHRLDTLGLLFDHSTKPDLEIATPGRTLGVAPSQSYNPVEASMTPLCIACHNGNEEVVKFLLRKGANPGFVTIPFGRTPIAIALAQSFRPNMGPTVSSIVEALLQYRPDLGQQLNLRNQVLHYVYGSTPLRAVQLLYIAGANINAVNSAGQTPLLTAITAGNKEVIQFLIEKGADVNAPAKRQGTVLHALARWGDWSSFKAALDAGADFEKASNFSGETLLCAAVKGPWSVDRHKILEYLIDEAKLDPNEATKSTPKTYPIMCSLPQRGRMASRGTLVSSGLRYLLDKGADPNVQDDLGRRPLHLAAFDGPDLMLPLLEKGVEPMPRDLAGMTPVHYAAAGITEFAECLEMLEKALRGGFSKTSSDGSKDSTVTDDNGPAQEISDQADDEAKLDINDKDIDGWTPLLWLCKGNHYGARGPAGFAGPIRPIHPSVMMINTLVKDRGADLWVTAKGPGDRIWTPLKAARYFNDLPPGLEDALQPAEKTRILADGTLQMWDDELHKSGEASQALYQYCQHCMMVSKNHSSSKHVLLCYSSRILLTKY
jgi:ankyrin repeat protein